MIGSLNSVYVLVNPNDHSLSGVQSILCCIMSIVYLRPSYLLGVSTRNSIGYSSIKLCVVSIVSIL